MEKTDLSYNHDIYSNFFEYYWKQTKVRDREFDIV